MDRPLLSLMMPTDIYKEDAIMQKMYCGKRYDTAASKEIAEVCDTDGECGATKETLYQTPNGRFFLTIEDATSDTAVFRSMSRIDAAWWGEEHSMNLWDKVNLTSEGIIPMTVQVEHFEGDPSDSEHYVHHIVFKSEYDVPEYFVTTNRPLKNKRPQLRNVNAFNRDGTEECCELMFAYWLWREEAMRWGEDNLTAQEYVKLFGPVENA